MTIVNFTIVSWTYAEDKFSTGSFNYNFIQANYNMHASFQSSMTFQRLTTHRHCAHRKIIET